VATVCVKGLSCLLRCRDSIELLVILGLLRPEEQFVNFLPFHVIFRSGHFSIGLFAFAYI